MLVLSIIPRSCPWSDTISNKDICPSTFLFLSLLTLSSISSKDNNRLALVSPSESRAPHFIRLSIALLLVNLESSLFIIFTKSVNSPPSSLSFTIPSITLAPTFFTATRPNLMWPLSTENIEYDLLISGGNTSIPSLLHSLIYSTTLSVLPITEVIRAAINSTG